MKLSELFEESKPDYFNRLENDLQIERLGNGCFARVFQHPTHPEVVVKVFTDEDYAYRSFLKFAQANQNNKYLPKILSVHKHLNGPKMDRSERSIDSMVDDRYTLVFMERLKPATQSDVRKFIDNVPFENESLKNRQAKKTAFIHNLNSFNKDEWEDLATQTKDSDLAEVAKFFVKILKNEIHALDLHNKNVMMRGSQLVFTDPTS